MAAQDKPGYDPLSFPNGRNRRTAQSGNKKGKPMEDSTLTMILVGALVLILVIAGIASISLGGKPKE
jgi:hypothetical protein